MIYSHVKDKFGAKDFGKSWGYLLLFSGIFSVLDNGYLSDLRRFTSIYNLYGNIDIYWKKNITSKFAQNSNEKIIMQNMPKYGFSLTRIFPYKDRIIDSVLIR